MQTNALQQAPRAGLGPPSRRGAAVFLFMNDQFLPLKFPFRGVDDSVEHDTFRRTPDTTPVGQNVRAFDAEQDRMRGGSRSGIGRFIDEQVSGENAIQFLGSVVSTDAEAMGWVFEGRDFGYTGVYGGIGFFGLPGGEGGEIEVNGGGGYPSTLSYNKPKYHLELEASASELTVGDTLQLTGRFKDENGASPSWEVDERRTVEFRTTPQDREGHLEQAGTNSSGVASIFVSNDDEEVIVYSARDVTKRKSATNTVSVDWQDAVEYTLTPGGGGNFPVGEVATIAVASNPPVTASFSLVVISGGLESGISIDQDDVVGGVGEIRLTPNAPESGSVTFKIVDEFGNDSGEITITWG